MVTTSTAAVATTSTITNNDNMLLYTTNNGATSAVTNGSEGEKSDGITSCNTAATLEQYRFQLYNYALNMECLRGPPYTAAAAMAAAAAYASTTVSATTVNGPTIHSSNYTATEQGPAPTSYLFATTAGSLLATTSHIGRSRAALAQCPSSNCLALASMSLFPQRIFQPEEPKPQHSYIGLIAMAILSSAETKLVLSDIYQYILDNYPYFRTRGPGWRNSIRHNLSLNDCFIKSGRSANGKGHYWAIHPANMEDFRKGDFRRRKAQRKVRKHMGLAVDDNGTDSPSPPPSMGLTSPSPPSFQHIMMGNRAISPLTTAAQHLATQSFGWRLTQHQHHRQLSLHPQSTGHATNGTAASYMGHIFTYRPQHYAAAAAAAEALCHSSSSQLQQQQLVVPTSQHQNDATEAPPLETTSLLSNRTSIEPINVQTKVINELFSQKRKRQFDVASLLAPDHSYKREFQQQPQAIRKQACESESVKLISSSSYNDEILDENQTINDLETEDIDVVEASEDEDIEADFDDEVDSNSNSHSASHSNNLDDDDTMIQRITTKHTFRLKHSRCKISELNITENETLIRVHDYDPQDDGDEEPNEHEGDYKHTNEENESDISSAALYNNSKDETYFTGDGEHICHIFKASSTTLQAQTTQTQQHIAEANSSLQTAPHLQKPSNQLLKNTNEIQYSEPLVLPTNADTHNLFGHYYGTYMAAAAAARINSSVPSVNALCNSE